MTGLPQDAPPELSKLAGYMQQLQDLQESDPEAFQKITSEISTRLQEAAEDATENGDTGLATALQDLAEKFQTASEDGVMPDLKPPQGARPAGPPPMGPPPGPPPTEDSTSSTSDDSTSSDASTTSEASSTTNSSSSASRYAELLGLMPQSNPMATLENLLEELLSSESA